MCGRFHVPGETQFLKVFRGFRIGELGLAERWNVAPTQQIQAIRTQDGEPRASMLRWQLIPWFAKGLPPSTRPSTLV
jgi:putative SOS response-associated peptidase YedK